MSGNPESVPTLRCLAVWLSATAAALGALALAAPRLTGALPRIRAGSPFDSLLLDASAAVLAGCALWCWLVTTVAVAEAVTGAARSTGARPGRLRSAVLAACGVALAAGAAPAAADQPVGLPPAPDDGRTAVSRLQPPDRATVADAALPGSPPAPIVPAALPSSAPRPGTVTVRTGDTLWAIAAAQLPEGSTDREVVRRWRAIWHANRRVVGPDPDHIEPRMVLRVEKES
jgi:hypothetical protein